MFATRHLLALSLLTVALVLPPSACLAQPALTGVGSCSSSNCHGAVAPRAKANIQHNEFVTWFKEDRHSQAYNALVEPDGKKIAEHLGIDQPQTDRRCLACHATWSGSTQPGERFREEDGVGCESCHGAAEKWLSSHTKASVTHGDNVKAGMVDLADLSVRAGTCAGCHVQSAIEPITHELFGAGHPRLAFELDTFQAVMPPHWSVDDDYIQRKGAYAPEMAWLIGQIVAAEASLTLLSATGKEGGWPEFSAFTCTSCHHSIENQEFREKSYQRPAGLPQLNVTHLVILREASGLFAQNVSTQLDAQIKSLHGTTALGSSARTEIESTLTTLKQAVTSPGFKLPAQAVAGQLLDFAANGSGLSYELAEQVAMGVSSLSAADPKTSSSIKSKIERLYAALQQPQTYKPNDFKKACAQFRVGAK